MSNPEPMVAKRVPVLGSGGPGIRVGEKPRPLPVTTAQVRSQTPSASFVPIDVPPESDQDSILRLDGS